MVATVIVGAMLLGFWAVKVTHHQHIAEAPSKSVPSDAMPEMVFVGRITGMVDVKWSDTTTAAVTSYVALGRKYALASGLMEITYDSGAKVILQGPCTYEAESTAGGYLSLGKLTARVGAVGGKGSSSKVQGSRSASLTTSHQPLATNSNPQSLIPNPLFAIRTPTAIVTDLGTEFGVEVDKSGATQSHVFRGKVKVLVLGGTAGSPSSGREVILSENESARVEPGTDQIVAIRREAAQPEAFARQMPEPPPVVLLRDTFDNPSDSSTYHDDYGLNQCLSVRQSGPCRPVLYASGGDYTGLPNMTQVAHAVCPGKLYLVADFGMAGWLVLYRNFPRNVEVAAELDPDALRPTDTTSLVPKTVPGDLTSENWMALGVRGRGLSFDHRELPLASDAGAVLQVRSNGKWGYFENGKRIAEGRVPPAHPYRVAMRVAGDRLEIQVNGSTLSLDPGGAGPARTLTGLLAETKDNFISLGACNMDVATLDINTVDNLTITQLPSRKEGAPMK
ncbi:MAG: FecR family protein [Planctomycetes bacterium]|nr:FecR family protein [Planctomycetota bacterium]MCG2683987.1 FecR family protein [Planctomycetales bacterium]